MSTDPQPVIRLEGAGRVYPDHGEQVRAVHGVDLAVSRGDLLCITGPSGSGKTTLLSLMAGLVSPTSGAVFFEGENMGGLPDARRAAIRRERIGFVFQEPVMMQGLYTWENVALPLAMNRMAHGARLIAETWLAAVGLADKARTAPRALSAGQLKRAALARALAADPPVILADEPTSGLDRDTGESVMDILCRAAVEHGRTVVYVTHDPHFASRSQRVLHMEHGRLTA